VSHIIPPTPQVAVWSLRRSSFASHGMEDRQQCTHNCLHGRPLRSCLRLRRRLSLITPDQGVPLHAVHHCRISGPRMATQTARASVTAEALSWPGAWSSQSAPLPFARSQAGVRQSSGMQYTYWVGRLRLRRSPSAQNIMLVAWGAAQPAHCKGHIDTPCLQPSRCTCTAAHARERGLAA